VTLVVDASAMAGWLLPDETGPGLADAFTADADICAPWLLWAEFRNILIVSERRGRLPQGMADELIEAVEGLGIALDTAPSPAGVLVLARRHGLTVYDALYLDLALRREAALATLDNKLAQAARSERVPLA